VKWGFISCNHCPTTTTSKQASKKSKWNYSWILWIQQPWKQAEEEATTTEFLRNWVAPPIIEFLLKTIISHAPPSSIDSWLETKTLLSRSSSPLAWAW
jgi:hypothetical protein